MVVNAPEFVAGEQKNRLLGRDSSETVRRIIRAQFVATFLASASCMLLGFEAAYSALLGGLSCALPSAFMAWRFLRGTADRTVAAANLVRGEVGKLLMTLVILSLVFLLVKPLAIAWFMATLVLVLLMNAIVPMMDARAANTEF